MKNKIKNFCIPLILMLITNLGYYYLTNAPNFGGNLNPHLGILFIAGLFFGPYGCIGAVLGNLFCDITRGYSISGSLLSALASYLISYLAYKLWYTKDTSKFQNTRPRLNNSRNLIYLILIILECGFLYSMLTTNITEIVYASNIGLNYRMGQRYFVNFINFSLLFSIIGILICRYRDFSYTPKISDKTYKNEYTILFILLTIMALVTVVMDLNYPNYVITLIETILLIIILILYIRKPIKHLDRIDYIPIPERIMTIFIVITLLVLLINILVILTPIQDFIFNMLYQISANQLYLIVMLVLDLTIILFFIPALILLTIVEEKVIKPIKSFSKIESFIKKDERIKSKEILDIYSNYINQEDEIGILSRSYTNLINNNNDYIDHMEKLEGEKQRTLTELNIAHNIQESTLPSHEMNNEYIQVDGFCKPAKQVGGDFYDFYEIDDENTMIIIGDASGKGVPAAIFTIIIQNSIKLLVKNEYDPAKVLYDVNNQICENNPEMMFITLFLAIYNKKTHNLIYANAGHNPPIIKHEKYEILNVESEIVMGIMEDYEFTNHEIRVDDEFILYTDGITDAQNSSHELYGEERILNCLNNKKDDTTINSLKKDLHKFSQNEEQFDDMTILTLKVKQ